MQMDFRINHLTQPTLPPQKTANDGAPVQSFASALENMREADQPQKADLSKEEILERLSPSSRAVLKRMEGHGSAVGKDEWLSLLDELKDMGAISAKDCFLSRPGLMMVPLVSYDGGKTHQLAHVPDEIRNAMSHHETWPCDPLEYYDAWEFILKKWVSYLSAEMEKSDSPMYECFSPINSQIEARSRVTSLVKSLIS